MILVHVSPLEWWYSLNHEKEKNNLLFLNLIKIQIKTNDFLEQKLLISYLYYTWNTHLRWKRFQRLMGQREHGEGVRHSTKELASRLRLYRFRQFHIYKFAACMFSAPSRAHPAANFSQP